MNDQMERYNEKTDCGVWSDFGELFSARHCRDGVLSAEFDSFRFRLRDNRPFPVLSGVIVHILVLSGQLDIRIDNVDKTCTLSANNIVTVKPMNELQQMRISPDFKGYLLGISLDFMQRQALRPQSLPIDKLLEIRSIPTLTAGVQVMQFMVSLGQKIERNFSRNSICARELTHIAVLEFHLEMMDELFGQLEVPNVDKVYSGKMQLYMKFGELVFRHCREEHEVAFYAGRLCVTPQYLARIHREIVGEGAKKTIDRVLASEAATLLHTDRSLQQVADELHFADQSSFGKFFKKHTGTTPARFRERNKS